MFALVFRFPAGRYHATPWGRNVNEADVAWPPEPWRILRTLIATYWRKGNRERWSEDDLAALIDALSERPPLFRLPDDAVHAHTRHYMPAPVKPTLIFDAFARLPADAEIIAIWPEMNLPANLFALAADLAAGIGYLGRAESWADCEARAHWIGEANCVPVDDGQYEGATAMANRPVRLIAARSASDYSAERGKLFNDFNERQRMKAKENGKKPPTEKALSSARNKAFGETLPERLLHALMLDTSDYQRFGWSRAPASREVIYARRPLGPLPQALRRTRTPQKDCALPTVARYVLAGRPRPRVEDTVKIGELMRLAAMSRFGWTRDEATGRSRPNAPWVISGRDVGNQPLREAEHGHAFWLAEDADGDGEIDHIIVYARDGLDGECRRKLDGITKLWLEKRGGGDDEGGAENARKEWRLALEGFGRPEDFAAASALFSRPPGRWRWRSATPYLTPWHSKKGFGWGEQLVRELKERGLPELAQAPREIASISINGRSRRPIHFHRFRSRRGIVQPDTLGRFVELTFREPLCGPLALGFACHFGLGLFTACSEER